jgi:predicted RNase H-like HicB family nuclease
MTLTLIIKKGKNGFMIGQIKEIPAVLTQGKTIEEVKDNIRDALDLYLEDMREEKSDNSENILLEEDMIFA